MPGFVRRYTALPAIETIQQIEGVVTVDGAPPEPATGVGTGNILLIGEFEDGLFATETDAQGGVEIFNANDYQQKFGGFGYTYDNVKASNPSARQHLQEFWNGNGYLKSLYLKSSRLVIARVDTSVGNVNFEARASFDSSQGNFSITNGDTITITTEQGQATSGAIEALTATVTGTGQAFNTISSGDSITIKIDDNAQATIIFTSTDINQAAVIARINNALGYNAVSASTTEIKIDALTKGTSSKIVLTDVVAGTLAKLGLTAGPTSGVGDVANASDVTTSELITFLAADASIDAINVDAIQGPNNSIRLINTSGGALATLQVDSGNLATKLGFEVGVEKSAVNDVELTIPAGTRVRTATGAEWVVMQTLEIPTGNTEVISAKVRPANDDGLAVGATAGTVTTLVDAIAGAHYVVNNPVALSVALTEELLDNRYLNAINATLNQNGPAASCDYVLCARRSDTVIRACRENADTSFSNGLTPRKFITGDPLGTSTSEILANAAKYRSDRVFYTAKGLKVRVPQIAERGISGGKGFTSDGVITVRPDGPLATLCAILPPEENPGQETSLINNFFEVDTFGETLNINNYILFKANGVAVPRISKAGVAVFQSGVTSSLADGRKTMARRKMADFIQLSLESLVNRDIKKLSTQGRRDAVYSRVVSFLDGLLASDTPEAQRIVGYTVDDSASAGNTSGNLARGLYFLRIVIKTVPSLDDIIFDTEIGENARIEEI